jgi:hypothetical protein
MKIYFYDSNMRYIGSRELKENEAVPTNSTITPVSLADGQEAHLTNNEWTVNDIEIIEHNAQYMPTFEDRMAAAENVILDILMMSL